MTGRDNSREAKRVRGFEVFQRGRRVSRRSLRRIVSSAPKREAYISGCARLSMLTLCTHSAHLHTSLLHTLPPFSPQPRDELFLRLHLCF